MKLAAPVSGWLMPLDEVPDPAFAGRMVGDGAAIDPTESILCAPCDGVVTMLAETRHALTLRADCGAEILLHAGIDTVGLGGEGLVARTTLGARVRQGDPLLEMDLDRLARDATSLITPIVVTDAQRYRTTLLMPEGLVEAGDAILEIEAVEAVPSLPDPDTSRPDATGAVTVRLEHGFHARPAARIARLGRQFRARVLLSAHGRDAQADSTVGLMTLGVGCGDAVELRGFGADAERAVRALIDEIASGAGEMPVELLEPEGGPESAEAPATPTRELLGLTASPGIVVGIAQQFQPPEIRVAESGAGIEHEQRALDEARAAVRRRLAMLVEETVDAGGSEMLAAQSEFLDDPALLELARAAIAKGKSAGFAWRLAIRDARERLEATGDARLAERAADLRDAELQVLQALTGREPESMPLPDSAIVLASELLPSELSRLDVTKIAGFCCAAGGPTSHVALLAASSGIPAVVGAGPSVLAIPSGTRVVLDADAGRLQADPDGEAIAKARTRIDERRSRRARFMKDAGADCRTADGCRIEVYANLASVADAGNAVRCGAEGCGLLRTEFLFHNRAAAPSAQEQTAEYQRIADVLSPRPLVIRLLDAGGDKPMPYLRLPREENPLLGLRGLRISLKYPRLLREQLAAVLDTRTGAGCRILLPMVTEPAEIRRVRDIVSSLAADRSTDDVLLGAMIETPASVALADAIARESDFLSIGSNDLAQYTLAMDRAHPELGSVFDYRHPAVLRQVAAVVEAAGGRPVSLCGALASDPGAARLLIGLGLRTLSAVPAAIPELKALIRTLSLPECRDLAASALAEADSAGLRKLLERQRFARRSA